MSYQVLRKHSRGGLFFVLGSTDTTEWTDTSAAGLVYLYTVKAVSPTGVVSDEAAPDYTATSWPFVDPTITRGVTVIKATQIEQLRGRVNLLRYLVGLDVSSFTDAPTPPSVNEYPYLPDGAVMKAVHIMELRSALDEVRSTLALPALSYTDPTLTPGNTIIKAVHIEELRSGLQ